MSIERKKRGRGGTSPAHLLLRRKMTDITRNSLHRITKRTHSIRNALIDLTRVRLRADRVAILEPSLLAQDLIQLVNLRPVALEDLHERGLCARRALRAAESEIGARTLDVAEVHEEILDPLACTAADGD